MENAAVTVAEDSGSDGETAASCWCKEEDTEDMIACRSQRACSGMVHLACESLEVDDHIQQGFRCSRCIDEKESEDDSACTSGSDAASESDDTSD